MPTFATPWDIYMDFINDLKKQDVLWTSLLTASADYANSPEGKVQVQEVIRNMVNTYAICPPSQAHTTILATEQNRARGGSKSKKRRTRKTRRVLRTRSKSR
jgi:hypothetical protein